MLGYMNDLPARSGVRPRTSASGPHRQLSQQSPPGIWGRTTAAVFSLRHVIEGRSSVSSADSRALFLEDALIPQAAETSLAPISERPEPVHLHGVFDTSLHLCLPVKRAREVCALGWGEPHRYAGHETEIMVYGPRNQDELTTVIDIVRESIAFARG
jgi:hypothetical protein